MTAQPKNLKVGQKTVTAPSVSGGATVTANPGDVILHESGAGWHVVISPTPIIVPVGGYSLGSSTDQVHWSQGPSFSGLGVPGSMSPTSTYDQVQSGVGTDGRISWGDGTIGGATGAVAGGVSGQSSNSTPATGSGGGSPSRAF